MNSQLSPFWTDPACVDIPLHAIIHDEDKHVAGLIAQNPGRLWHYMTGQIKTIQSSINRGYYVNYDDIQYVKVPAVWSTLIIRHSSSMPLPQSMRRKDGWAKCLDPAVTRPELLKPFDYSLLEPTEKIPDGLTSKLARTCLECA